MSKFSSSGVKSRVSLLATVILVSVGLMVGIAWAVVVTIESPPPGFGEVVIPPAPGVLPFVPLTSLETVPNPVIPGWPAAPTIRADLTDYIADLTAARQLGKALFWDMQAGSDNKTACATCHFHAGADDRATNQLNPGANKLWLPDAPNYTLMPGDFPFTIPTDDTDSIAGSQGIRKSTFQGLSKSGAELTASVADPVFNVGGVNTRQVTGAHSPSTVNAVFSHRQFWNGRAQPDFNGVNPFGRRDLSARVWVLDSRGSPVQFIISIQNASLASQAVGPPLNTVEMSAAGRTFPDLGKKMLALKPLGLQKVSSTDSLLGSLADPTKGLTVSSYKTLIQKAFQPKWWNTSKSVSVGGKSYTMMQADFSLYWGLALMIYEATLVSDRTPMDLYLASRVFDLNTGQLSSDDPTLLEAAATRLATDYGYTGGVAGIKRGLDLFEKPVALGPDGLLQTPPPAGAGAGCSLCHVGAETTSASMRNLAGQGLEPGHIALKNAGFDLRMERMFMTAPPVPIGTTSITFDSSTYTVTPAGQPPAKIAVYDAGWYNIGVRPTQDDLGVGGSDPWGKPLSWTEFYQKTLANPGSIRIPGGGLGAPSPPAAPATSPFAGEVLNPLTGLPLLSGPLLKTEATDVAGSFKTPGLRNVELTGPYLHNGGKSTLLQALEFYNDGGDFAANPTLSPLIRPRGMTPSQVEDLVAFLASLTDDRVLYQQAPFDHPELVVPNGQAANGTDITIALPSVGAAGGTPLRRFLDLNPFAAG